MTIINLSYLIRTRPFALLFLLTFNLAQLAGARIVKTWSYQDMFDKADLVVIARFISTKDTDERTSLRDLEPPSNVVGVVSEFETLLTMKGSTEIKQFRLHHYRLDGEEYSNGPALVRVAQGKHPAFLLFLLKEDDGRYAPITGQTDPAAFSVLELKAGAAL